MRTLLVFSALVLVPAASAAPSDLLGGDGDDDGLFDHGLVWGVVGLGSAGALAAVGVLYYLGVGGLRHVDRENVLEHPMRQALLTTVQERPGVHLRELAGRHGTAVTNTQWHLRKLEMAGLVKTQKVQGRRLYYPVQGGLVARAQALENAALANPNAEALSIFLAAHAGCNQRTLVDGLRMNPGTVRWHLRRLEEAGLVRSIQEGAQTRYFLMRAERPAPMPATVTTSEQPVLIRP
jgi:predicted transcriptional regulator